LPPAGGVGAAMQPRAMLGAGVQALSLVHQALKALQLAMVGLPMGTDLHTAVLNAVRDLTRKMTDMGGSTEGGDQAGMMQALVGQMRNAQANPQGQMMNALMAQRQGQPAVPTPPPGGGGPSPPGA